MFRSLWQKIRQVMYRMGLIRGIQKLEDKKDINISEEMYRHIDIWKALYQGYYKEWHDIEIRTLTGTKPHKMRTLNMAKVAAEEMATLVFNERCSISIGDEALSENIEIVLEENGFKKEFQRFLEYQFALGGMVIKGHVENDEIKLSYVKADSFLPTGWTNKKITEGIFLNETIKGDKKYTHLEWHYWEDKTYVVCNELYESSGLDGELGIEVPITKLYPDLEKEVRIEGLERSLFVYIKPNSANNVDMDSPLGVSIFANALDSLRALDVAFDSFEREFRLGKKRILVPDTAIRTIVDPDTGKHVRYFDANDEVYQAFKFENEEGDNFKDLSVELRVDEHVAAINSLLNLFAMQIGFSAGSFSFDGQSMKTATEVVSENSKTFRTKQSHEVIIEEGLIEMIDIIVDLAALYKIFPKPSKKYEVSVTFDDSIAEDKTGDLNYWTQLVTNKLATRKRAIMSVLGLTEDEAEQELLAIAEEDKQGTPEMIDFFGMNRNEEA